MLIKSSYQLDQNEEPPFVDNSMESNINKITEKDSNLETSKNLVTADSDSDDSDFEISMIEKGVQVSQNYINLL